MSPADAPRILAIGNMYPPHHLGGAELIWASADRAMRERGWQVRVLCSDHRESEPDPSIGEPEAVERTLRWYWADHDFPRIGPFGRLAIERHNRQVLSAAITDHRPDAIVFWSMGGMSMSLIAQARRAGIPALGVLLDEWLIYGPRVDGWQRLAGRLGRYGPLGSIGRAAMGLAGPSPGVDLGADARWVFMSETLRRNATGSGLAVGDAEIALRGPSRDEFSPRPDREFSGELLYLGRIDPRKGIAVAVRTLAELPGARLTIVGGGEADHRAGLERLADELGVAARLRWRQGPRAEIPGLLAAADALIFPVQWSEPWGLVPLEAMASGVPVIATGTGGSSEYLRDGENCLLYAPADEPAALASQIERLRDSDLRGRLREGGLRTASEITEEGFNERIIELTRELIDG